MKIKKHIPLKNKNQKHIILMNKLLLLIFSILLIFPCIILAQNGGGQWEYLQRSIGVAAMHMQLLSNDRVIIFDRTDFGPSNLTLPPNECRHDPNEPILPVDCTAHSVEYNPLNNTFRPLHILTDTWCSSGVTLPNGNLVQTGGYGEGDSTLRVLKPCPMCDWQEFPRDLLQRRWYATNHILPDGRVIIIGGTLQFNYEFVPRTQLFNLPFLSETRDNLVENNLYPFVFLNVDGNLFIFAHNRAILLDYNKHVVVRTYPTVPGGDPRNYPSTGSAVLLPLKNLERGVGVEAEVVVCGGAPYESFFRAQLQTYIPALNTCARIKVTDPNATWVMETMPMSRVMGDMILLPNGNVIIINGAGRGVAGWDYGRDPVLSPLIYHPNNALSSRFEVMTPTTIPRMYHSSAILLRDGRILVGGSNPHHFYNFTNVLYPTELSLEAFSPPYLDQAVSDLRPIIELPVSYARLKYGDYLPVRFSVDGVDKLGLIDVTMIRPPFNTHTFSMSQRLLVLTKTTMTITPICNGGSGANCKKIFDVNVMIPGSPNLAPPGFYILFVVHQGVPSIGTWVQLL